jgi:hypothetical protein
MISRIGRWCLVAASAAALAGCSAEIDTDRPHRVERVETTRVEQQPAPPPVVISRPEPRYEPPPQPRYEPPPAPRGERLDRQGVPRDAVLLEEGPGRLNARANQSGTVYLYDIDDGRVVWSGNVERGDAIRLDADADAASINGRIVYRDESVRRHRHRIFIDTNPR